MGAGRKCQVLQTITIRRLHLVNLELEYGKVQEQDYLHSHGNLKGVEAGLGLTNLAPEGEEAVRGGVVVTVQASGLVR